MAADDTAALASAALRTRLEEVRDDALRQLAAALPAVDGGLLALVANISAVLSVMDAEP